MNITGCEKVEDCFDGSSVLQYAFDAPWTGEYVKLLSRLGDLDYYPHFPRPFFRLRAYSGGQVKGVEGDTTCRVILPAQLKEEARQEFESLFGPASPGGQ